MDKKKVTDVTLKALTALLLAVALVLTFTVSDYYIFNRMSEYGVIFSLCQWVKKAGLLLLPLAVFYRKKSCSDVAKYVLPLFVIVSCFTFGDFFEINPLTEDSTEAEIIFAGINLFIPKAANIALFFISNALYLGCCALLFVRDGWRVGAKSFIYLPVAIAACAPLNIFENFFDISDYSTEHFLWFKNFTIWHLLAILILAGSTVGCYYFLKNKDKAAQQDWLAAIAITLLIQYHSKDSMLLGDGYNVYNTVFSALPLFICNIGVYVASLSVILKKRVLYAISFFVHAVGALTVFVYFGKDEMSNYGIIFSYSILYFCLTHCLLFILSVIPSALGHYKFRPKDCIIPLIYYCIVIIIAAVASGLVTSYLQELGLSVGSEPTDDMTPPNFAFTQVNPLPIPVPVVPLVIWKCELNLLYLILLYIAYVCLFWAFTGCYYAFLAVRKRVFAKRRAVPQAPIGGLAEELGETAYADEPFSGDDEASKSSEESEEV